MNGLNLRGANYKRLFDEVGDDLKDAALGIKSRTGKLTARDIGRMAQQFNLPIKTTFEFLEHREVLPTGTWQRLCDRGLTAKQVIEDIQ